MVSVNNKAITEISNIGTSTKKITSEGLDNIFAELFSTVDMSSIEDPSVTHPIVTNKSIENNLKELINNNFIDSEDIEEGTESTEGLIKNEEASIEAAKSLISIFYKEALIEDKSENNNSQLLSEVPNNETDKANYNFLNNPNLIPKKNIPSKQDGTKDNQISKKRNHKSLKPSSQNYDLLDKESFISGKKNKDVINQNTFSNNNLNKKITEEINPKKIDFSLKKIKKKNERTEQVKLNVTYSNIRKTDDISKHVFLNERKLSGTIVKEESIISNSEKITIDKKINSTKLNDTRLNQQSFNTESQETLDLLESSWGEKFVRVVRQNIKNGQYRINLSLEPKNLGKLKIEVELNGDKTEVKINADNKITANILNENQQKLSEMMEKDQLKLGNFSSMMNDQKNSKNHSDKDKEKTLSLSSNSNKEIKNIEKDIKVKKTIHNVDINA